MKHLSKIVVAVLVVCYGTVGGGKLLAGWGMSPASHVALATLLVAATLWVSEVVPLFVTSLVILFLNLVWLVPTLQASGQQAVSADYLSPFFSDVILLFLGGFVLSAGLHRYRLDEQMARWIMRRAGGSIPRLMLAIMATTAVLSMWLSNTATAAMMIALCLPIIETLPAGDPYRKGILLAIPFSANIGGLGTPIGSPPNAIAIEFMRQAGLSPQFGTWMLVGVPGVVVMLAVAWGVLMLLFRGQARSIAPPEGSVELPNKGPLITILAGTAVTVLGWVTSQWHPFTSGTVALIPVILFFGTQLLDVKDLRNLSWDVLLVMGGGMSLGVAIDQSGLADWLLAQLPVDNLGLFGLLVVFGATACLMTSVMSNTATANLLMPIALGLSAESLSPLLLGIAFCCSLAMPLPISTPPNAMAFGSGQLTVRDMLKPGLIITIAGATLALTTGYWWWGVVGLY